MNLQRRFTGKQIFLAVLCLTVLLVAASVLAFNGGVALGSGHEVKEVKQAGWSYFLDIQDSTLGMVAVSYNVQSAAGVEAYAAAQRQENARFFQGGAKEAKAVSIVFRRTLSWDEADAFVKKYGILAYAYQLFGANKSNPDDLYSFTVGLTRDGKNPQSFNDGMREKFEQHTDASLGGSVAAQGVSGMQVDLTRDEYNALKSDADVYLVEMFSNVIKAKLKQGGIRELQDVHITSVDNLNVSSVVGDLYRNMARNHIAK